MAILGDQFAQCSSVLLRASSSMLFYSGLNSFSLPTISPATSLSSYSLFLREHMHELDGVRLQLQLNRKNKQ